MTADRLAVVIPALNESGSLPATLRALEEGRGLVCELIVVDGGSSDTTRETARDLGAQVLRMDGGRGAQLAAGAEAASAPWLLFLHADTTLEPGWSLAVRAFLDQPENRTRGAVFCFALDDPDPRARRVERWVRWRSRLLALPYGDQGLVIARDFYRSLGGFPPIPLMEDVSFLRRIGRARLVHLETQAYTSASRYRRDGWWVRPAWNLTLLGLYFLGASPNWLKRRYG